MKITSPVLRLLSLFCLASLWSLTYAQSPTAPSRQESEPLIRTAIYETALSTFNGDIKLYRRHIARRTLELGRLVFEGLQELPDDRELLKENGLDTAEKFFDAMFVQGASQYGKLSRDDKEQRARAQSNGQLVFLNDHEVILQFADSTLRIIYEDKEWKVDETEASKELFLKNFEFTEKSRAKIQKL